MSDPNNPNVSQRTTPQWGLYQRELFWAPNEGKHPPFNTRRCNLALASASIVTNLQSQTPTN